jgi:ribonuclease R
MRLGLRRVRVVERLAGGARDPRAVSLICLHEQDIPIDFPAAALSQAEAAAPVGLGRRTDLRAVPLVTIDGADARDFDDAVWAEPDPDPENPGGWRTVVAIADVAHYVRPGDALDREAYKRGNSVYFPDRVVPMLPEPLSNGLCSLKPNEDRACLAVEMIVGPDGRKRGHRFMRGLMRSSARLTYEQVQGLADGNPPDDLPAGTPRETIGHLYAVYAALAAARSARGALELDMPERKVELDGNGHVKAIGRRQRLVSHQLIEELMILANVAAAEALERQRKPCMYRVHETPDPERVAALREFLDGMGLSFASGEVVRPKLFNRLLTQVAGTPQAQMVNELVLRSQAQAFYGPNNLGHFGLGLQRYAHFTSPIRRYADLLVHRGLIAALGLGDGGSEAEAGQLEEWGSHVSSTERRAAAAERAAMDRYAALYMADRVGEAMEGRVVGVTRFGLFVTLESGSADGLVPIRSLPQDYYDHDSNRHELAGRSLGHVFRLGDVLSVRVTAVDSVAGTVTLDFLDGGTRGKPTGRPRVGRGRPPPRRTSRNGRRGR